MSSKISNEAKLKEFRYVLVIMGIFGILNKLIGAAAWILFDAWWLFVALIALEVLIAVAVFKLYLLVVSFICPECGVVFKPTWKEVLFAKHTKTTRNLKCPNCSKQLDCEEVWDEG